MTKPIKNPKQENKGKEVDQSLAEHSENAEFEISQFFTKAAGEPSASNLVLEEARQELNAPITHKDFYDHLADIMELIKVNQEQVVQQEQTFQSTLEQTVVNFQQS